MNSPMLFYLLVPMYVYVNGIKEEKAVLPVILSRTRVRIAVCSILAFIINTDSLMQAYSRVGLMFQRSA